MDKLEYLLHLEKRVGEIKAMVEGWKNTLSLKILQTGTATGGWSALQCIHHLNLWAELYMLALERAAKNSGKKAGSSYVRHGWIGKKFTQMLSPDNLKPQKTVSLLNAGENMLGMEVLDEFLKLQERILALLTQFRNADLNRRAIPFAFFKPLKLRCSDVLNIMISHEERHILQGQRAIAQSESPAAHRVLVV